MQSQFLNNAICKKHINYCMAYSFLIVFNLFGYFLIIYNVFNFDYGENETAVKFFFYLFWLVLSLLFSRYFCIIREIKNSSNTLTYDELF